VTVLGWEVFLNSVRKTVTEMGWMQNNWDTTFETPGVTISGSRI